VLYHIQEVLGFGKVDVFPDKEHGRYVVWDSNTLLYVLNSLMKVSFASTN